MPIRIPDRLPAAKTLKDENIFVMTEQRAMGQDIRPLKILLLNLMPTKIATETQLSRLLSNTPLQVELELIAPRDHVPKNTPQEHMLAFYRHFDDVRDSNYDGMVITGAPVEHLPFEEVGYWPELCEILEWSKSHVHSTFHICWGAQAGLYYHYGIQKQPLEKKLFGVFPHIVERRSNMLFRGSDDVFMVPHSRHTTILREDVERVAQLKILATSPEAGIYALSTESGRQIFITGHSEYDADTLDQEYRRDKSQGKPIGLPQHYYPGDDDTKPPRVTWRSCANLLYSNWLNYFVYQTTPYDLSDLPPQGGRQNPAECKKEEGSNHG
jgi:homoserine O-succinyltransferase